MNLVYRYQYHLTTFSDSMDDCDLKLTPRRIEYYEEVLPKLDEIKDYKSCISQNWDVFYIFDLDHDMKLSACEVAIACVSFGYQEEECRAEAKDYEWMDFKAHCIKTYRPIKP